MISVPLLGESERLAATRVAAAPGDDSAARSPEAQRWGAEAAAQYPLRERLARLSQRLLVLRPRDDLSEATARVRQVQPTARLSDLDDTGAELLAAAPGRVADAVRQFLRS